MLNITAMTGRLVETPELRHTKGEEISVTSFRIAVKRDFARKDDADTDFFDVVAWRSTAEFICKYFKKGSLIQLYGRLQNRAWIDKYEQNRVTAELVVERAYFGDSKDKDDTGGGNEDFGPLDDSVQDAPAGGGSDVSTPIFDPFYDS
jgi:single-strand DNA-binding protein